MSKSNRQSMLVSMVFGLLAISAVLLAGAVYLAQSESSVPATATAYPAGGQSSPSVVSVRTTATTTPTVMASASSLVQASPSMPTLAAPSQSVQLSASPTWSVKTPVPAQTFAATPSASPTVTQAATVTAQTNASSAKIVKKTMTIQQLIKSMKNYPLDRYGSLGIVKRGGVAYYAWARDLYLIAGNTTKRILRNVDCTWMYADESNNLWFGVQGGFGIVGSEVLEQECAYRYDCATGSFTLMRQESNRVRFPDGQGFLMVGPYYLYVDGGALMACHTVTGHEIRIDTVAADPDVRVSEGYGTVYYRNARREYIALSGLGESDQASVRLDMAKFPGGKFRCENYIVDDAGRLFQFRRTGYVLVADTGGFPSGSTSDSPSFSTDGGIGFPGVDTVTLSYFDVAAKAWISAGTTALEGTFCQATGEGRFWFVNWKPACLFQIYKDKCAKYNLSGAMSSCIWAGMADGIIFLSENDFYSSFTHVYLPDQRALYEITFPPLPGDKSDR